MRRNDKEIADRRQIDGIIRGSLVCRAAMACVVVRDERALPAGQAVLMSRVQLLNG